MIRLVIEGAPRTKKTHQRILRFGKFNKVVPSAQAIKWERAAIWQLQAQWQRKAPLGGPVSVCALVYREKAIGDLVGYLQAVGDALEKGGVLFNDRLIVSWDGSRLLKDAARPRVEVTIEEVGE